MAKLVVKLYGDEVSQIELIDGEEYIAGRANDAEIVLERKKGISRQHLRFFQDNGEWAVEVISKFGNALIDGQSVESAFLEHQKSVCIPPYEFTFITSENKKTAPKTPEVETPPSIDSSNLPSLPIEEEVEGNMEATSAGVNTLVAYLTINRPGATSETLRLEGNYWQVGRDESCEIPIVDHHISRKHLELQYTNGSYFVTDLGSSNGTHLNGAELKPNEPYRLASGDLLCIMSIEVRFEVRDNKFQNKLAVIPDLDSMSVVAQQFGHNLPATYDGHHLVAHPQQQQQLAVVKVSPNQNNFPIQSFEDLKNIDKVKSLRFNHFKNLDRKQKIRFGAIFTILLAAVLSLFQPESGQIDQSSTAAGKKPLSPEQKAIVKDTFNLARNHFMQAKYELCRAEIHKLHKIVSFYENSMELKDLCTQAIEMKRKQEEKIRKVQLAKKNEEYIQATAADCRAQLKENPEMDEVAVRKCMAAAIELNPEHASVQGLIDEIHIREERKRIEEADKQRYQSRVLKGKRNFNKALALQKKNRLNAAIKAYKHFLRLNLPDPGKHRPKAKRNLASLQSALNTKMEKMLSECQKLFESAKFKEAIQSCDTALQENKDNTKAKELRGRILSELRRDMKAIYEDSVLEESLGNVDAAKEKWKRILKEDISSDDYYKKSKNKLRKYGIGI